MKKNKCEVCHKNKARRTCQLLESIIICSLCCANLRNAECGECEYYKDASQYHALKESRKKEKPFVIEINEEVENSVDHAMDLVERGEIDNGRRILEKLFEEHPENHQVLYGLGVVHAFEEQYDEAIELFGRATETFPYFVEAHFNRGMAYKSKLDLKNTIKCFQKTVEIGDPHDEYVRVADSFIKDFEVQIMKTNEISLEKYFEGQEHFEKAFVYMEQGRPSEAITEFSKCLQINKRHPQSYGNIGICYALLGQRTKSLAALDKALEINPEYEPAMRNRAMIEPLKEGEKLPLEKVITIDYSKDCSHKQGLMN